MPQSAEELAVAAKREEEASKKKIVPKKLMCPICTELMQSASIVPCCANHACDECKYIMQTDCFHGFIKWADARGDCIEYDRKNLLCFRSEK